ncbi:glycosyltransferase family 2 protein [Mesoterricola silvestris]|uniref:Glycosyl transferase n=1 Tax=Mesoterricola silvestris TaxID=2927979 RepID=A0AA48GKN1_9BACT|nr:glycosyltransferase family 2 protein [Mesoterricola silvestris]BDU74816.1 glycosyl transferase [Mesoterricola silvestris]
MVHISVVTPVYKAERILPELHRRLRLTLEAITPDFEIIMVNDHSPENDWAVIRDLAAADPRVKGLDLSRNFGQHFAITAGLDHAQGDWIVVMDCDLQDQPEEIAKLYAKAQEGYDAVFGRRHDRKDAFLKKAMSTAYYRIYGYLIDGSIDGRVANFSIISRQVAQSIGEMREHNRSYGLFANWVGFRTTAIDIDHAARYEGLTSYTSGRLIRLAIDSIVSQSNKPLRLFIRLGFFISLVSFAFIVYILYRHFFVGIRIEGWASVMVSLWFISGLLFMNLGILGLYIGKTFDETKRRPLYVVRDRIGLSDHPRD